MKKRSITILLFCIASLCFAESVTISINNIPNNLDELIALRDEYGTTPEGGVVVFILAMMLYVEDQDIGLAAFTIALARDQLDSGSVYQGYQPGKSWYYSFDQLYDREYLPYIYIDETDYSNAYSLPEKPYKFIFTNSQETSDNTFKVFIQTTSGNMPRPVSLVVNNRGVWKVTGASSLFVGASRTPALNVDDDL